MVDSILLRHIYYNEQVLKKVARGEKLPVIEFCLLPIQKQMPSEIPRMDKLVEDGYATKNKNGAYRISLKGMWQLTRCWMI